MADSGIRLLTDEDMSRVDMSVAVDCMEDAFRQHAAGNLFAPGRIASDVDVGQLVFTTGALAGEEPLVGFRCYDLQQLHSAKRSELTVVLDGADGSLHGLAIGPRLGAIRTGAIGGVAVKYLAPAETAGLGMIGCGFQAETQLAAALAVRSFKSIRVYSRDAERRSAFAVRMSEQVGQEVEAVDSAQAAVDQADVVLCTTTSSQPVLESEWLRPGAHVSNVGPKFTDSHELSPSLYDQATVIVTDAPAQAEAYGDRFVLHGSPQADRMRTLSEIVSSGKPLQRDGDDLSLFISLGLAGTEVLLAKRLLDDIAP